MKIKLIVILFVFSFYTFSNADENEPVQDERLKEALVLINEGKSEEAVGMLDKMIAEDPENPHVHLAMGIIHLEQQEFESAEESLKKSLELKPESVFAYYMLALLYEKQKQSAQAIVSWQKVLELSKDEDLKALAGKHLDQLKEIVEE